MNNRRTAPGGQTIHMLSVILAKVTNIEKLLAPAVHNLPDSEILDSMMGHSPFIETRGKYITVVRMYSVPCCWKKKNTLKNKRYEEDD